MKLILILTSLMVSGVTFARPIAKTVSCNVQYKNKDIPNAQGTYPTFQIPVNKREAALGTGYIGQNQYTIPNSTYQLSVAGYSHGAKDMNPDYVTIFLTDTEKQIQIQAGPAEISMLGTHGTPFAHKDQDTATLTYHLGPQEPMGQQIQYEVTVMCWMK